MKAGDNSANLLNEIRQTAYSLYQQINQSINQSIKKQQQQQN